MQVQIRPPNPSQWLPKSAEQNSMFLEKETNRAWPKQQLHRTCGCFFGFDFVSYLELVFGRGQVCVESDKKLHLVPEEEIVTVCLSRRRSLFWNRQSMITTMSGVFLRLITPFMCSIAPVSLHVKSILGTFKLKSAKQSKRSKFLRLVRCQWRWCCALSSLVVSVVDLSQPRNDSDIRLSTHIFGPNLLTCHSHVLQVWNCYPVLYPVLYPLCILRWQWHSASTSCGNCVAQKPVMTKCSILVQRTKHFYWLVAPKLFLQAIACFLGLKCNKSPTRNHNNFNPFDLKMFSIVCFCIFVLQWHSAWGPVASCPKKSVTAGPTQMILFVHKIILWLKNGSYAQCPNTCTYEDSSCCLEIRHLVWVCVCVRSPLYFCSKLHRNNDKCIDQGSLRRVHPMPATTEIALAGERKLHSCSATVPMLCRFIELLSASGTLVGPPDGPISVIQNNFTQSKRKKFLLEDNSTFFEWHANQKQFIRKRKSFKEMKCSQVQNETTSHAQTKDVWLFIREVRLCRSIEKDSVSKLWDTEQKVRTPYRCFCRRWSTRSLVALHQTENHRADGTGHLSSQTTETDSVRDGCFR